MAFNPVKFVQAAYKNSPWVVISIGFHVVVAAVIAFIATKRMLEKAEERPVAVTISAPQRDNDPLVQPEELLERKSVPKNEEAEIVTFEEDAYIPTEAAPDEDLHLNHGDPTAADNLPPGATGGTSIGAGGAGHFSTGAPSAFATRRAGGGGKGRGGVTQGTEKAVLEGLRWLLRHKSGDGSWSLKTLREQCCETRQCIPEDHPGLNDNYSVGLTGLSLLCFLGAGYDHTSKQNIVDTAMAKRHYIGETIKTGLMWLRDLQQEDGGIRLETYPRTHVYNQAVATMALAEAYGMTQNRAWKEPAQRAVDWLVRAQKQNPADAYSLWGWKYASLADLAAQKEAGEMDDQAYQEVRSHADTSATTWVVMALKSAKMAGLKVPDETMAGALAFVESVTRPDGAVGYETIEGADMPLGGPHAEQFQYYTAGMSALAMLCRTWIKYDAADPMLAKGADRLIKFPPTYDKDTRTIDYYYWYNGTLALNQFDGPDNPRATGRYWNRWNEAMKDVVLKTQDKNEEKNICSRGGWLIPDRWSYDSAGPVYATAINILTLEVYYRYGNAFTGVEKSSPKKATKASDKAAEDKAAEKKTDETDPADGDEAAGGDQGN